jgi:phosphoglycerate dehydrogenase-like enzyme
MTRPNPIVILHTDNPDSALESLSAAHPGLPLQGCDSYAGLPALLDKTGAEVIFSVRFAGTPGYPRAALLESKTLKWLSVGGSGTDHMNPWDPSQLTVTNAAGVAADMMAEYAIGAMLSFSLDLRGFARAQAAREWIVGRVEPIAGKTVLILGLGKTGQAVALRAQAMGMTTLGVRARPKLTDHLDEIHGMDALPGLWARADFIVCCVPLLESTRKLIGEQAFAVIKPGAVLIDVSRGGVVDEAALVAALQSGKLRGAALDVFTTEPLPRDHVLWGMQNVIITPHCSSVYDGWEMKSLGMFSENLHRYRRGEALENVVDPARGY